MCHSSFEPLYLPKCSKFSSCFTLLLSYVPLQISDVTLCPGKKSKNYAGSYSSKAPGFVFDFMVMKKTLVETDVDQGVRNRVLKIYYYYFYTT